MNYFISLLLLCLFPVIAFGEKHHLNTLKQQLKQAQKDLNQASERVLKLEEIIAQQEIIRIRKEIDHIQENEVAKKLKSNESRSELFIEQREVLAGIIRSFPDYAPEAQAVLDKLLSLITHVGDQIASDEVIYK